MSALTTDTPLPEGSLKAPPGQFRVVKVDKGPEAFGVSPNFFLVGDHSDKHEALEQWRELLHKSRGEAGRDHTYRVYNEDGRVVDALGVHITERERKAPPGKFRVIAVDYHSGPIVWLVADMDDRGEAIEYAKEAYEGPYTGFQVHDDTGAALIPV